jgi:hypothetical protein
MASFAWRRSHGTSIVAEVSADGRGAWQAAVWLTTNPSVSVKTPRGADTLSSAQQKADMLARKTFDHRCDAACGEWIWERVSSPGA